MNLSSICLQFQQQVQDALSGAQCDGHWSPRGRTYLIGNGGSSAVASHICNDLVKRGHSALTLSDPSIVSCIANDDGWASVYQNQLERHWQQSGTLVAISSSGRSQNIINAARYARDSRMTVVTLSGFDEDNPLRKIGSINYWVPSWNYGVVEIAHLTILHSIANP